MNTLEVDIRLKLFVWENVLYDYASGIMFALANDVEEARRLLWDEWGKDYGGVALGERNLGEQFKADLTKEPRVYTKPCSYVLWGGA